MSLYRAFGLTISSDIECPGFAVASAAADVTIRRGPVADVLDAASVSTRLFQAAPGRLLLTIPSTATYLVQHGREIVVDADPAAPPERVQLFLFGSAMGALLHQRGLLPLHASAVSGPSGAIAFAGVSGSGKSTLAAAFARRGYEVLTDDVCAIDLRTDPEVIGILPSFPRVMVWADAAARLDLAPEFLTPALAHVDKYHWPVKAAPGPCRFTACYVLTPGPDHPLAITRLTGLDALVALRRELYRTEFSPGLGLVGAQFAALRRVAAEVPVARLTRPTHGWSTDDLVEQIEEDICAGATPGGRQ